MWVKICANTTLRDTQMAIDCGADAVGFVFAPSSRRMTPEAVREITAQLTGPAEWVGVFQTEDYDTIAGAIGVAGLTGVQLHGVFDPALIERLHSEFADAIRITQTMHWKVGAGEPVGALEEQLFSLREQGIVDRVLVDSQAGQALGGTGRRFDWGEARALFSGSGMKMVAAGGLEPENVGTAIEVLEPWGVDVATGVEMSPGRKDRERLGRFVENARAAGEAIRS